MPSNSPIVAWMGIPRAPHVRDRRLWCLSIALSVTGFSLYALYKQERVAEFSSKLRRVVRAGRNAVDVMTKLSEISQTVLSDIQLFLDSDGDTLPHSLRQVSTLLSTTEFRNAIRSLVMAAFEGLALSGGDRTLEHQPVFENLVERIVVRATRRPDLMSIAVRLATRNAADELLSMLSNVKPRNGSTSHGSPLDVVLSRVATENGRHVMSTVVTAFTSTLVSVCIDKARGVTTWDEVFRVISRPSNLRLVHQLTGVSSREFARSCIDRLSERPRTTTASEIQPVMDPPLVISRTLDPMPATQAVSNLMESFVQVAHNDETRKLLYQFFGCALAEVIKVLLKDIVEWSRTSALIPIMTCGGTLLWELFIFCCVPLIHCLSTSYSIQTYPSDG